MAMRAATMSSINNATFSATEPDHFMRKLVILILLITAAALGIVLLFRDDKNLPLLLSTFFADASMGLVAGFGSRIVLSKQDLFVRSLTAIVMTIAGMTVLGFLTDWVFGIGPISVQREVIQQVRQVRFDESLFTQLGRMDIDPRTVLDFTKMEPSDAAHLAAGLLLTVMSLQAWRRTATRSVEVTPLQQNGTFSGSGGVAPISPGSNGQARVHLPVSWFQRSRPASRPRARIRSRNRIKPTVRSEARPARRSLFRRKPHVQLALVEEHRCPYCLDPVTHNDPRGVKECEVCNTLHHADCWAITGVCQVPHLNT